MESKFVSPGTAFGTDTDTVVGASVRCDVRDVELREGLGVARPLW